MYISIYAQVGANGQRHASRGVEVPRGYLHIHNMKYTYTYMHTYIHIYICLYT